MNPATPLPATPTEESPLSTATNGYAPTNTIKVRDFHPGMGRAVAERTILRKRESGRWEEWRDVAGRVAQGNAYLCPDQADVYGEFRTLRDHIAAGRVLMSGRHLQHGDSDQPDRNMEVFCNCSTASSSFLTFYLLLNGSGVGRCYDDAMMLVDWDDSPAVRCVLAHDHPDFDYSAHESARDAEHKYGRGPGVTWFAVPDSREGWAKALELVETMAYERAHRRELVVLDFSGVRPKGSPIDGMQGRPSCGPVPTMNAFAKAMTIRGGGLPRWKQALYVDHYFAESVLVGGARRAARIATKTWRDDSVLDFVAAKRPIEFRGKSPAEILAIRAESKPEPFLWSANMTITVDSEFWAEIARWSSPDGGFWCENATTRVFTAATKAAYYDGTGEPAFVTADRIVRNPEGIDRLAEPRCIVGSAKYQPEKRTRGYLDALFEQAVGGPTPFIVNPCGEIVLASYGGFCVIADCVPYHADSLDEAEDAVRTAARALIRVNLMDSVYKHEVARTNRIGVGLTGIHEFAWKFFGYGFRDLLDEAGSRDFWMALARLKRAVRDEAAAYSARLGVATPHTDVCIKPAGTTSKLFGLTEGAHLPAMPFYVRWVQFRTDDPLVATYRAAGYEVRELATYRDVAIVGFPTTLAITGLGMGDKLVTAGEATVEEQYLWLMLLEKYWIRGVDEAGEPLAADTGNQISYTLKYDPATVSYGEFADTVRKYQPLVRCCAVMPCEDQSSYEYLPEQPVTKAAFEEMAAQIRRAVAEDVDQVHVDCAGGACPIEFAK